MAESTLPIEVREKTFIKKYAEGVDPLLGEPYDIVEGPDIIYTGQAAIDRLNQLAPGTEII